MHSFGFNRYVAATVSLADPIPGTTFSIEDGKTLFDLASNRHGFHVIENAGHYDLYDKDPYVDEAADKLEAFYQKFLA